MDQVNRQQYERLGDTFLDQLRATMADANRDLATFFDGKVAAGELAPEAAAKCQALVAAETAKAIEAAECKFRQSEETLFSTPCPWCGGNEC